MELKQIINKWKSPNTYGNYEYPPESSGVYVIVMTDLDLESEIFGYRELVYIGRAKNLKKRYVGHEVLKILKAMFEFHHVGFFFLVTSKYIKYEKELIEQLQPKINCHNVY